MDKYFIFYNVEFLKLLNEIRNTHLNSLNRDRVFYNF